jgi:arabinose-5-phosphate isomerase
MMQQKGKFETLTAKDIMNKKPKQIESDTMAIEALDVMKSFNITQLVVTEKKKFVGFIHLHDLLKEGII